MSYVPPHLRNKKTEPVQKEVVLRQEDFPALGGGGPTARETSSLANGSFAEQALRWKEKREHDEYEQRVKKEMDSMRAEKKKRELFEEQLMRQSLPHYRRREQTSRVVPVEYYRAPSNEWEVVGDKEQQKHLKYLDRKERERLAKLNKEELSEESGSSQNDEEIWPAEDA